MKLSLEFRPAALAGLRNYDRSQLAGDVAAGVTVGVVALPLAMAFAIASGLSPQAGIFTEEEFEKVRDAIDDLAEKWMNDGVPVDDEAEDIHSLVERELGARCGDLAKRIHTGRSRNDQVATDLRLFLRAGWISPPSSYNRNVRGWTPRISAAVPMV